MYQKLFFLRKLNIKKIKVLLKKDIYPNLFFYNYLLKDFEKKKKQIIKIKYIVNNNLNCFYPAYKNNKQVFNTFFFYKLLEKKNDFFYVNYKNNFGLNLLLLNNKNFNKNVEQLDDFNNIIIKKFNFFFNDNYEFNYFFNYNIFILQILEIYKIITILNINLINKINIKYI